jgi:hypothetical protein
MTCHTAAAGRALSFNTRQLNRDKNFGAQTMNQLAALGGAGYFTQPADAVAILPKFSTPDDATQSLEHRARSYLAFN